MASLFAIRLLLLLSITDKGRSCIKTCCSYILRLVISQADRIIVLVICFIVMFFYIINFEVAYCMDSLTEMSHTLQNKIAQVEYKIKYFQEQAQLAEQDFKNVIRDKEYYETAGAIADWQHNYDLSQTALRDTNTNLNSETRMLKILKARLESGFYDMPSKVMVAKRKFTD